MELKKYVSALARRAFRVVPIKQNKVVFSSYYGRGYSDNPKAIADVLLNSGEDLDLVWLLKNERDAASLPEGIRAGSYSNPVSRAWHLMTAKVWVDNCRKGERCKRPGQYYMQTWHGFALKRIEKDAAEALEPGYVQSCIRDSEDCDLMVSGSAFMTGLHKESFWYDGEVAEFGTPRNDVFFRDNAAASRKVRRFWSLPEDRRLLLYAPTFRADHSTECYCLDAEAAAKACEDRFGGRWSALIRLHPNVAAQSKGLFPYDGERIIDATAYPDMADLLLACDLLITDYSSSMFDYALGGKPCLRFAPDIEAYRRDRGFYFSLDSLPFPLASSNEELKTQIENFDEEVQRVRWEKFASENGFCEDGHAAERCAQWILDKLKG